MNSLRALVFSAVVVIILQSLLASDISQCQEANLTNWRQHRRQKRFILFENSGICKLVCGITYPVDLSDKKPWRQLVLTMNLQYQFPVPPRPIYWWNYFSNRALPLAIGGAGAPSAQTPTEDNTDQAQMFLYEFAEELMNRREMNGSACMQRAICENAQIHRHRGVFAQILQRVLMPHNSLDARYQDAFRMGRHGVDCRAAFASAQQCLLDPWLHVREEHFAQSFVI